MQKEEKPDKRQCILNAAERLFFIHGFDGTTTRMIARESGANLAMINYYFGGKEGVLRMLIHTLIENFRQVLTEGGHTFADSMQKLEWCAERMIYKMLGNVRLFKLMQGEMATGSRGEIYNVLAELRQDNLRFFEDIINEGIEKGEFAQVDATLLALTVNTTVRSAIMMPRSIGYNFETKDIDEEKRAVMGARLNAFIKQLLHNNLEIR